MRAATARVAAVACALAGCAEVTEQGATSRALATPAGGAQLAAATIEPPALLAQGLPITSKKLKSPRVVYAAPLDQLAADETLLARAELSVSRCASSDLKSGGGAGAGNLGSPCEGMAAVTGYDPEISLRLVLAADPTATAGLPLTPWIHRVCSSKRHHCAIPIAGALAAGQAPAGPAWVNLVAGASGNGQNPLTGEVVELEGDCAGDDYAACQPALTDDLQPSKGKLTVVRLGAGRDPAADPVDRTIDREEPVMPVRSAAYDKAHTNPDGTIDYRRTLVYQLPVAVAPGDIVEARGEMHTHAPAGLTQRAYLGSTLLLVADEALHRQNPGARTHPADRFMSGHNGFNCRAGKDCVTTKLGAAVVPADAPPTMWVVQVAHAVYAREKDPNARVKIRPCQPGWTTCGLEVTVRRAAPAGATGPGCGDGQCGGDEDDAGCPEDCGCAAVACADPAPFGCYCDPGCAATGDCCSDAASCQ